MYILIHVYINTDFSIKNNILNFYLKRFAKIYPTYFIVTIVYFLIFREFSFAQYVRIILNDLFLLQGFFKTMFYLGINGGTWSLTTEIFLYFLFPFFMILLNNEASKIDILSSYKSYKILFISFLLSIILSINVMLENSDYIYANPLFRVCDFMCGMGFYFIRDKIKNLKYLGVIHIVVLLLLYISCRHVSSNYMSGQFIILPLFGLWIVIVYYSKSIIYNNKLLEYLGLISYSFYLWQFIPIALGKKIISMYELNIDLVVLGAFLINIVIASLSYHFIEERVRLFIIRKYT